MLGNTEKIAHSVISAFSFGSLWPKGAFRRVREGHLATKWRVIGAYWVSNGGPGAPQRIIAEGRLRVGKSILCPGQVAPARWVSGFLTKLCLPCAAPFGAPRWVSSGLDHGQTNFRPSDIRHLRPASRIGRICRSCLHACCPERRTGMVGKPRRLFIRRSGRVSSWGADPRRPERRVTPSRQISFWRATIRAARRIGSWRGAQREP